ncbi:unnamed protein product, partial [Heterosigma akashiwo]
NAYVAETVANAGIRLRHPQRVRQAAESGPLGVFHLFLKPSFFAAVFKWTNKEIEGRGGDPVTTEQFMAYVGLEIATSIVHFNNLKDYWSKGMFRGYPDFKNVMSRTTFQNIRGSLKFYPSIPSEALNNPLWHSKFILEHIRMNIAALAVSVGAAGFDENSLRCKAACAAVTYIPSKPDEWAIRFYVLCAWLLPLMLMFWDNNAGNTTGANPAKIFAQKFGQKKSQQWIKIPKNTPSALWVLMMMYQCKMDQEDLGHPSNKRMIVMDNYYTRTVLGDVLSDTSQGNIKILGTCKL